MRVDHLGEFGIGEGPRDVLRRFAFVIALRQVEDVLIQQVTDAVFLAAFYGDHQRVFIFLVADRHVRAVLFQQFHDIDPRPFGRLQEDRVAPDIGSFVYVMACFDQVFHCVVMPEPACEHQHGFVVVAAHMRVGAHVFQRFYHCKITVRGRA